MTESEFLGNYDGCAEENTDTDLLAVRVGVPKIFDAAAANRRNKKSAGEEVG